MRSVSKFSNQRFHGITGFPGAARKGGDERDGSQPFSSPKCCIRKI